MYLLKHKKIIFWILIVIGGGYFELFNHGVNHVVQADGGPTGPYTFISTEGTLNQSTGQFTQSTGTYTKFIPTTPTPIPTLTPGPTPTCPPPDPNPVVTLYTGTYSLNSGEQGTFILSVRQNNLSSGNGIPKIENVLALMIIEQGTAIVTLQITGSTGTGTIQLIKNGATIDTGTITIDMKLDVPPIICIPDPNPTPTPAPNPTPTPAPNPTPTPDPSPNSVQAETRTWTLQGITYAYAKVIFPDSSYKLTDGGKIVGAGSDFSVDVKIEQNAGQTVPVSTTTAQIYTLGALTPGTYSFTFKSSGTMLKTEQFTVSGVAGPPNSIDDSSQFVRQQYMDFLGREPDKPGLDFWVNEVALCADPAHRKAGENEANCVDRKRVNTSGAFFLSTEFQSTSYFIYRFYKGSLDRLPKQSELRQNAPALTNGIVVNNQLDLGVIENNKVAFANQWVTRADFKAIYDGLDNQQYVDKLFTTTGVTPTVEEKISLVNGLNGATETRATVLRKVVDGARLLPNGDPDFFTNYGKAFYQKEYNSAFVLIQYFGYLQRDVDDSGYQFWLSKLNQYGNFIDAQMVRAFVTSAEYRSRFGQP